MQPRNLAAPSSAVCQQAAESFYQPAITPAANFQQSPQPSFSSSSRPSIRRATPTCSPSLSLSNDHPLLGLQMHNLLALQQQQQQQQQQQRRFVQPSSNNPPPHQLTDPVLFEKQLMFGGPNRTMSNNPPQSRSMSHSQSPVAYHAPQRLPLHQRQYDLQVGMKGASKSKYFRKIEIIFRDYPL
ncbi:hypothetical protein WR25_17107 [Diploscapter pachys]|uniref:Uncharacterized protein n=1 Tax=Diploscapter pachys TaxID=2018661 RepID=A0A2A2JA47_9BILA|nr:hypothetical protein WR25_17107 [Diploscapter pachys]